MKADKDILDELKFCAICHVPVDTREVEDGGSPDGAQLSDGRWVCSSEHWDAAIAKVEEGRK